MKTKVERRTIGILFSFFTNFDQISRVGSRDRHTRWRSDIWMKTMILNFTKSGIRTAAVSIMIYHRL